jgi:hypothetical protein
MEYVVVDSEGLVWAHYVNETAARKAFSRGCSDVMEDSGQKFPPDAMLYEMPAADFDKLLSPLSHGNRIA